MDNGGLGPPRGPLRGPQGLKKGQLGPMILKKPFFLLCSTPGVSVNPIYCRGKFADGKWGFGTPRGPLKDFQGLKTG